MLSIRPVCKATASRPRLTASLPPIGSRAPTARPEPHQARFDPWHSRLKNGLGVRQGRYELTAQPRMWLSTRNFKLFFVPKFEGPRLNAFLCYTLHHAARGAQMGCSSRTAILIGQLCHLSAQKGAGSPVTEWPSKLCDNGETSAILHNMCTHRRGRPTAGPACSLGSRG